MNGIVIVDMRGGGLVYAKSFTKEFTARHPQFMNLAALMFAIVNYSASIAETTMIQYYDTREESMTFESIPSHEWLLVLFTTTPITEILSRFITQTIARACAQVDESTKNTRASYHQLFQGILDQVYRDTIAHIARSIATFATATSMYVRCFKTMPNQTNPLVSAASSKWKRRLYSLLKRTRPQQIAHSPRIDSPLLEKVIEIDNSTTSTWPLEAINSILDATTRIAQPTEHSTCTTQLSEVDGLQRGESLYIHGHSRVQVVYKSLTSVNNANEDAVHEYMTQIEAIAVGLIALGESSNEPKLDRVSHKPN